MSSRPWYHDGLRFSCTQCGDCCTGAPGYVWVGQAEIEALSSFLGISSEEFGRSHLRRENGKLSLIEKPNGDCIFYDRGCTVYPVRPEQCRTFPFWSENLRSRSAWESAAVQCPGMDRGRLYAAEDIVLIRRGERAASARGE
jgi:Fe-S-cluster containining protein